MMKKVLALPVITALIFTLASCGGGNNKEQENLRKTYNEMSDMHKQMEASYDSIERAHQQWLSENRDSIAREDNTVFLEIKEQHEAMMAKHRQILDEHEQMIEKHNAFLENPDIKGFTEEELSQNYQEMEAGHERMKSEHEKMKQEHQKIHEEHKRIIHSPDTTSTNQ